MLVNYIFYYNNKSHGGNKSHMINGKNYYDQNYY
jgi:hypothetical protein